MSSGSWMKGWAMITLADNLPPGVAPGFYRVEITKAGKLFARLMPATPEKPRKLVKPDIMAQLKETWGDRVFSAREVAEMRAAELEGEEG